MSVSGRLSYKSNTMNTALPIIVSLIILVLQSMRVDAVFSLSSAWESCAATLSPPFLYAAGDSGHSDADATWTMLRQCMRPDDGLVVLYPDGNYTLFTCETSNRFVFEKISRERLESSFPTLRAGYARIWIVLDDPRLAWNAQPYGAYKNELLQHYMRLPCNLPVYFASRDARKGSTNFYLLQAAMLERIITMQDAYLNPTVFRDLGTIYRKAGDVRAAVAVYNRGVSLFPADPYLHRALGECLYWSYDPPEISESITHNLLANRYYREQAGAPMYDALFNAAIAYNARGDLQKAALQYNAILKLLLDFPDNRVESQIRRYLATVYAAMARTNDAINQLQLDIHLNAQNPAYSYNKLLDWYKLMRKTDEYRQTVREYFALTATNDLQAVTRYSYSIAESGNDKDITDMIALFKRYIKQNADFTRRMQEQTGWWNMWTNLTISRGYLPVEP